jgi:bacteriocin biosynthesis cyclodehydratase domain-containing protein
VSADEHREHGPSRPGRVGLLEGRLTPAPQAPPADAAGGAAAGAGPPRLALRPSVEVFPASTGEVFLLRPGEEDLVVRAPDALDRALLERLDARPHERAELLAGLDADAAALDAKLSALDAAGLLWIEADPAGTLDGADAERFARQLPYFADAGDPIAAQRLLRAATVVVLGCGGLGTWALAGLACAGVGGFVLIDDDHVDLSNLNRQILYAEHDVGAAKVERAAAWLAAFDPAIRVRVEHRRVTGVEDLRGAVAGADALVQAADRPPYELARWVDAACREACVPWIAAGQVPPLLKVGPAYVPGRSACFACHERQLRSGSPFYDELVARRRADTKPAITLGPASGIVGTLLSMDVVHLLAGVRRPATEGRALIVDMRTFESRWEEIAVDPACPACGGTGGR